MIVKNYRNNYIKLLNYNDKAITNLYNKALLGCIKISKY